MIYKLIYNTFDYFYFKKFSNKYRKSTTTN